MGAREGRQRRRHDPRVERRHHDAARRLRRLQARAATTPIRIANDKPLFTITAGNMRQVQGQADRRAQAMLKKYPDYKMIVYPTHRSAAVPAAHLRRDQASAPPRRSSRPAATASIGARRHSVPDPEERQRGDLEPRAALSRRHVARCTGRRPRSRASGDYALVKFEYEYDFSYGTRRAHDGAALNNVISELHPGDHGAGAPRGPDPARARDGGPVEGDRARRGSTTPASAACASRRTSPTTTPARRPTACAPTTTSACTTAPPTATTGSSSARRRCTSRTTRTSCRATRSSTPTSSSPATSTRTSRATSCTACGWWTRR